MKPIVARFAPAQVNRILADHVLDTNKPKFSGHVSASMRRVPASCDPTYWGFELTLVLKPARKRKAKQ